MKEQEQEQRRQRELAELIKRGQAMEKDLEVIRKQLVELQRQIAEMQKRNGDERKMRGSRCAQKAETGDFAWACDLMAIYFPAPVVRPPEADRAQVWLSRLN